MTSFLPSVGRYRVGIILLWSWQGRAYEQVDGIPMDIVTVTISVTSCLRSV